MVRQAGAAGRRGRSARIGRRRATAATVVVCLALLAAVPAGAVPPRPVEAAARVVVDPRLGGFLARGPAPVVLSWDRGAATAAQVTTHLTAAGLPHRALPVLPMVLVCATSPADLVALRTAPGARSVWGDEALVPADATTGAPSGLRPAAGAAAGAALPVSAPEGATGRGVGIAVLDTGVDATHPDLERGRRTKLNARVLVSHYEIMGIGEDTCMPDTFEDDVLDSETVSGHGTALAGIAAGDGTASAGRVRGVAPAADVLGLSIVEQTTPQVDSDAVKLSLIRFIAAVSYVLSRSLEGGPMTTKVALLGWVSQGLHDPWHPHTLAVRDLVDFGISVVVPVGNGGPGPSRCDVAETCAFNPLAVGDAPIGVGATAADGRTLQPWSSRGDPVTRTTRGQVVAYEPTLVAPGTAVLGARRVGVATYLPATPSRYPLAGTGPGAADDPTDVRYQAMTGTSVAAAQVAGAIALMQQAAVEAKGCFLTPAQVKGILASTARALPDRSRWEVGAGALDVGAAVTAAQRAPRIWLADPWMCPA